MLHNIKSINQFSSSHDKVSCKKRAGQEGLFGLTVGGFVIAVRGGGGKGPVIAGRAAGHIIFPVQEGIAQPLPPFCIGWYPRQGLGLPFFLLGQWLVLF